MYRKTSLSDERQRILTNAFFRASKDERGLLKAYETQSQYRLRLKMGICNKLSVERMSTLTDFWPHHFTSNDGYATLTKKLDRMELQIEQLGNGPLIIFNAEDLSVMTPNILRFPIVSKN